ncbi:MAG: 3-dehydroquinate dehydratase-2, partial [Gammaproteobacteria bacterium]
MASILLLNGPNLNLLGTREPAVYGGTTLKELETNVNDAAAALGHSLDTFQSNVEGDLVNRIHT